MKHDPCAWFEETKYRAIELSESYRRQLDKLWWANLAFVVSPAVFSALAAILAAGDNQQIFIFTSLPLSSVLAASSAILTTVHKTLKCEDYQAECLRLSQAYQSIAIIADSAGLGPAEEHASKQKILTDELEKLAKGAKAQVSSNFFNPDSKKGP